MGCNEWPASPVVVLGGNQFPAGHISIAKGLGLMKLPSVPAVCCLPSLPTPPFPSL